MNNVPGAPLGKSHIGQKNYDVWIATWLWVEGHTFCFNITLGHRSEAALQIKQAGEHSVRLHCPTYKWAKLLAGPPLTRPS